MYDLGDELIIESHRVRWLIWIQLLVTFLLIFLLYSLSVFVLDLSNNNNKDTDTGSPSSSNLFVSDKPHIEKPLLKHNTKPVFTNCSRINQAGENLSVNEEIVDTSTSRRIVRSGEDIVVERENTSFPNTIQFHPCNYLRLARLAFLKCLGLDCSSENSTPKQTKRKQS